MSDKATDKETGISIRFVKQYDIHADLSPKWFSMCHCGMCSWSKEEFEAHWLTCPDAFDWRAFCKAEPTEAGT